MKSFRTKSDLEKLISDRIEENAQLEYKAAASIGRSDGRKRELTKDVSSLANASGGTIIFGITESKSSEGPRLPEKIDPVDTCQYSKEWLDQILGQIRPRIPGLEISAIHVGPNEGDYVFVVDVPQGSTAHQALDCKYYARRNFEITAMVDFEVRDVMQRTIHPTVDAELRIIADYPFDKKSHIAIRFRNTGEVMARHYAVVLYLPIRNSHGVVFPEDARIHADDGPAYWSISFTNKGNTPLFPGSEVSLSQKFKHMRDLTLDSGEPISESISDAKITIYADNMPKVTLMKNFSRAHKEWT
ncbi:MAG: ATP-binding protein [Verrucomicrobiota bacterium]